jgi:hypothetical protein
MTSQTTAQPRVVRRTQGPAVAPVQPGMRPSARRAFERRERRHREREISAWLRSLTR